MAKQQQRIKGWRRCRCSGVGDRPHWIPSSYRGSALGTTPTLWWEYNTTRRRSLWTLHLTSNHDPVPLKSPHEATAKMTELLLCQT